MEKTLIKAASFWDGTHPLSELQERLCEKLVPCRGEAATAHGELLRAMTNLYYDVYNNGYCNHEVLAEQRDFVNRYKPELVPLLANADSWRKGLHTLLKAAGDAASDDDMPAEAECLEDIVTAVIKYVAAKEGIALPSA